MGRLRMKKNLVSFIICLLILTFPFLIFAHSGRTDSSGGHRDNKNKSGLGSYHYHCGGNPPHLHTNGVCPYKGGTTAVSTSYSKVYAQKINAVNVPQKINAGDSVRLEGKVYPSNSVDDDITWSSNDTSVVFVDSVGNLKAVGVGTAIISAKTERGTTSKFTIKVDEVVAEKIEIENKTTSILVGNEYKLNVLFTPENTTYKNVTWTSDNEDIVTISTNGVMIGKSIGETVITAIHNDLTDSFEIEVMPVLAEEITIINPSDDNDSSIDLYKLKKGEKVQLEAQVLPDTTTNKTAKWSVSDMSIAEIDENGLLTGLETGTVVVTATTDNGIKAELEIKVYSNIDTVAGVCATGAAVAGITMLVRKKRKK